MCNLRFRCRWHLPQGLNEAGFVVDLARDGIECLYLALTEAYDLAVLDVMLPGVDGWQILQGIRKAGKEMQVWDMNFDSDTNVIEVAVRRLRAKIDEDDEPKLIHTVRGMGYVLEIVE